MMIITSDSYTISPELPPLVRDDVDTSEAGVDENVEDVLGVIAFFVAFPVVHGFYRVELAFHEDLTGLASLTD